MVYRLWADQMRGECLLTLACLAAWAQPGVYSAALCLRYPQIMQAPGPRSGGWVSGSIPTLTVNTLSPDGGVFVLVFVAHTRRINIDVVTLCCKIWILS